MSHKVWATSIGNNTNDIKFVMDAFRKYFEGIPIFPLLGNHEPHPINM